jgi:hypothetical protein
MSFECKCCKYKTIYKTNFDKHLLTKKHKTNSAIVDDKPFTCKYCSQKYKYKQSLSKHVKYSCTKNKDEDLKELVRLLNNKLENQDKELKDQSKQIENKDKQIEKLKGKLEINNSFNTNTTINNIQNITLLSYTETDTSHLTDHDYKKCIETKNWCVVKMIEKVHFNPKKPENMNLYIPNIKDKYVMMYEDGNWKLNHTKDVIEKLYDENEELISEWVEIHPDENESKEAFERYLWIKTNDKDNKNIKSLHNHTKILLYNNRPNKKEDTQIKNVIDISLSCLEL